MSFVLLCLLLCVLWLAGGASRADAPGQAVVQGAAWLLLIFAILFGDRPSFRDTKPVLFLLAAAVLLVLLQLVPLPPEFWQALPGRGMLREAADASGQPQPWRPWSIVPGATASAASSLIVPVAVLYFTAGLKDVERSRLPGLLLCLVVGSVLVALTQVSGIGFHNLLVNNMPGQVSGIFANRNHFALFMALGCLLVPAWAFMEGRPARWRAPVALGLVLLFSLMILASGSRAGLILGFMALVIGLVLAKQGIKRALGGAPRWAFPALIAAIVGVIAIFVTISVATDRAVSINRIVAIDPEQDMRSRAMPTVIEMIRAYFPAGSGIGGFDPIFRMHEPLDLLKLTYFNHAHNDLLEIVLDAGLPGLALLLCGLSWWAFASFRAWRAGSRTRHIVPKLGAAMLLLIILASAFDYPARTPMIMAMVIVAGIWLNAARASEPNSALPVNEQHL
jgi:O-antigen ligase